MSLESRTHAMMGHQFKQLHVVEQCCGVLYLDMKRLESDMALGSTGCSVEAPEHGNMGTCTTLLSSGPPPALPHPSLSTPRALVSGDR